MKSTLLLLPLLGTLLFSIPCVAQDMDNPGTYVTAVSKTLGAMDAKYMAYVSAAAHGRRARKVEKLRQEVLDNITDCRYKMTDLPMYKGDNSLRQAGIDYIKLVYIVFSEDYKKIVDVEELAEQSVDEMQAYLLLQDKVSQKLTEGWANLDKATKAFADKYHVTLTSEASPLGQKLETADKLDKHINAVYLAFFKCNWEDNQLVKAMNDKKVNDMEQARSALASYAAQGLKDLDTVKPFEGDASLIASCRRALQFYQQEAEKDVPKLTDFYVKSEEFDKLKKSFDAKGSGRTKEDVDAYNKAVNDINASVKGFNQTNQKVNAARSQAVNDFNDAERKFADEHMPHYR
ncbi:LIC11966 family surface protein [Puia dinghuensis]|uniref:DUF3829 domain-containing protein n=1 Tax=Puia dinghuensis TaxID=1792502 RepID=A0A8J2XQY9_9BACT|nr:hypothetical protein [Puia dinghuensis]GGA97194.1 hypothetical protein GCM10011511_20660 [Puia dinghuensis]